MNKYWADKRVFITGITGIVGSWLAKALIAEGAYVVGLIRDWDPQTELIRSGDVNSISVLSGCLEDYSTVERAINDYAIDTVFHLGAQTIVGSALKSPLQTLESNIRGTYNLLEAIRRQNGSVKRIVIASSDKAYGESEVLPYREDFPLKGNHPYDVSKSCADLISQAYSNTYGMPVVIARCGNIYGGGDLNWSRLVPGTIRSLLIGEPPVIRSDGTFVRDYVYVKDIIDAYLLLARSIDGNKAGPGEGFNFSYGRPMTVLEMVDKIKGLMGKTDVRPVILNAAHAEIKEQYLSSAKAKEALGWSPKYDIEEGLRETIKWYKEFLGRT